MEYIPYLYAFKYRGHYIYSYKFFKDQGILVLYNLFSQIVHVEFLSVDIFNYLYYHEDKQIEFENIAGDLGEELCYYKHYNKQGAV